MFEDSTRQWIRWARHDPYYAVLSEERFRDGGEAQAFDRSGEALVAGYLQTLDDLNAAPGPSARVLDFGCGVGRLTAPLARRHAAALGLDVSPDMIDLARRRCRETRADFRLTSQDRPVPLRPGERFDLLVTSIVLQHIPVGRGSLILRTLLDALAPGGVAVVQAPYHTVHRWRYRLNSWRARHQWLFDASRLLMGRFAELGHPVMQMNIYPPPLVQEVVKGAGCELLWVGLERDPYGYLDLATWYIRKSPPGPASATG